MKSLVLFCVLAAISGYCMAATYYVDGTNGSDGADGLSLGNAWETIGKADSTLVAGDTVYVRAGTYNEILNPHNSGSIGSPITYENYLSESVTISASGLEYGVAIGRAIDGSDSSGKSYIVVDGFTIDMEDSVTDVGFSNYPTAVLVYGDASDYCEIRDCTIVCYGHDGAGGGKEIAIGISKADHATVDNCTISGYPHIGISMGGRGHYTTVTNNTISNSWESNISIGHNSGNMQNHLIEGNTLSDSAKGDGIQLTADLTESNPVDDDDNRGTVIRDNIIRDCNEDAIDLKGGAFCVIEGNTIYGHKGDSNGDLDGENTRSLAAGIKHGSNASSRDIIVRNNVFYDTLGGILPENGYKIYNNTIVFNNRDFTGTNSSYDPQGGKPVFVGIQAFQGTDRLGIKNNIIGGHSSNHGDIAVLVNPTDLDIDNNLYFHDFDDTDGFYIEYTSSSDWSLSADLAAWRTYLAGMGGVSGAAANSLEADPCFVDVDSDPTGVHTDHDFNLKAASAAIDAGAFLTTTVGSGSGTSITVDDAGYFYDGYDVRTGDEIQLDGQIQRVTITDVNYVTNIITVDESLTWDADHGVSLVYEYSAPDIGALEVEDATAPTPDAMTWDNDDGTVPTSAGETSITMTADTATDTSAPVAYYFTETTGGSGGSDSGWQASSTYTDNGLSPNTEYTYTVKARDASPSLNETEASSPASATTDADVPPPIPSADNYIMIIGKIMSAIERNFL